MTPLWLLLHLLGFVLWMGGGFSSMLAGIRGRREDRRVQGAVARIQAALHRTLILPGALLTVVSGGFLTMQALAAGVPPKAWLMVMQGAGVLAALLVIFVSFPAVSRLAQVDPEGPNSPLFDAIRKRQALAGSIAGSLGIIALIAGVMNRY